jgi:uncharacterized protein YoxC
MQDDPRKAIVEVMARLGRETQLHIDERHEHFKITDGVIKRISILLLIVAMINVYLVWVLSENMDGIVNNMDSMRSHLTQIDDDMTDIAITVEQFDAHITYMYVISSNIGNMTANMPLIRVNTDAMTYSMQSIDNDMEGMKSSISEIGSNMFHMTGSVSGMGYNVRQFSKPMGVLNPMFP